MIHILHIGKTGGTAVKTALEAHVDKFALHGHSVRLSDCPVGEIVFFAIRDPIDRFVSAFNSRLRKGLPRYFYDWSAAETAAFSHFPTANELAEALTSRNPLRLHRARVAMSSIKHVKRPLDYWLSSAMYLAQRRDDLVIGETRTLQSDFDRLMRRAGLAKIDLPTDPVKCHKTGEDMSKTLSDIARRNIGRWYAADVALYEYARELRREVAEGAAPEAAFASEMIEMA